MFSKKSEIIFIGAGKVAHTLVPLLIEKGYSVKGIINKTPNTADKLAKKYQLKFYTNRISGIPVSFKIFFITVPDNEIKSVAEQLSKSDLLFEDSLFVHTSGSESCDALKAVEKKGGMTASFHIMQTFPSLKKVDVRNSFAAIETESITAEEYLFSIARTLNLKGFKLSKENKVYYHLCGVFAANFLNANFYSSEKLLDHAGSGYLQQYELFEPIVKATLSNIKNFGVANSLSGPVERGDYLTIVKHISAIKKLKMPARQLLLQSYISQSLILLEVVRKQKNKLSAGQKEVKRILEKEMGKGQERETLGLRD